MNTAVKITLLLVLLITQGCFYQIADMTDIKKAQQFCQSKGGVKTIRVSFIGNETVICVDGEQKLLDNVVLKL